MMHSRQVIDEERAIMRTMIQEIRRRQETEDPVSSTGGLHN